MSTDQVNRPGSVFRMQHCYIHDANGGNNVKSRSERNEIYYNWLEGAYYHELELIGPDPYGVVEGWTPELKREDSDIVGNVLWKKGSNANFSVTRVGGDATGETHGRYRFVNNTFICGTGSVFRCFDALQSLEMHNNVFFPAAGNTINMMREVEADWAEGSDVPQQWTGTLTGTDPGFADFTGGDVRLLESSPLRNAGAASVQSASGFEFPNPLFPPAFSPPMETVNTAPVGRPMDQPIDIGAYEFGSGSSVRYNTVPWMGKTFLSGTAGAVYSVDGRRTRGAIRFITFSPSTAGRWPAVTNSCLYIY
jgi:hypothetical protein